MSCKPPLLRREVPNARELRGLAEGPAEQEEEKDGWFLRFWPMWRQASVIYL